MNVYKALITFYDYGGREQCHILGTFSSEHDAFMYAVNHIKATNANDAEIWVLAPGSNFWKVQDRQGRIVQRPVTREA